MGQSACVACQSQIGLAEVPLGTMPPTLRAESDIAKGSSSSDPLPCRTRESSLHGSRTPSEECQGIREGWLRIRFARRRHSRTEPWLGQS